MNIINEFSIIEKIKTPYLLKVVVMLVPFVTFGLIIMEASNSLIFITLILFLIILWVSEKQKKTTVIGTVVFGAESLVIKIRGNQINYLKSEVSNLRLKFNGVTGEPYPILTKSFRSKKGDLNFLSFKTKFKVHNYEIILSKNDKIRMDRVLKHWGGK